MIEVQVETASSFRDLVTALRCSPRRIIDVGAGGFVGDTTTVHLVELFPDAQIVAVEPVPERVEALRARFGARVEAIVGDIATYRSAEPFDLTVVDLDPLVLHGRFRAPFDNIFADLTAPGGLIISDILLDFEKAFHGPRGSVSSTAEAPLRDFMQQNFGTFHLDGQAVEERFADQPQLQPIGLVEKWRGDDANFMGWVAFRRR